MSLTRRPFERQTPDEEYSKDVISVRLSPDERAILTRFQEEIGEKNDSTALKLGFITGSNVIQHTFNGPIRVRLFKRKYSKYDKMKPGPVDL